VAGLDYKWIAAAGGDVGVAANWSPYVNGMAGSTPPGAADEGEFAGLGGTIAGTVTVTEWVIDSGAGPYTFSGDTTATFFKVGASAFLTGTWTQNGASYIDIAAGTFTIGSGAELISHATGATTLGLVVDSVLLANGGTITVAAGIGIGYSGAASLSANSGASLSAATIDLAGAAGASGTLNLSGGATASVSGIVAIGATAGAGGAAIDINAATLTDQNQVQVGLQSNGTLTVQGGGLLSTSASLSHPILAAGGAGSTGTVDITDAGSELNAGANQIEIGAGGTGSLTVEGGATLVAGGLFIAEGGTGTVDVTGALTTATIGTGGLGIGEGGTGQLTLQHGGTLTVTGGLDVGVGGTGTFDIESGATLTSEGAALAALSSSKVAGTGTVLLDAAQWLSSGQITVGAGSGGTAELQVADGATLEATATLAATVPFLYVDENVAGHASADVGGAATVLDAGSNGVLIAAAGFGALTVHDGAELLAGSTGTQAAFLLGEQSGSVGTATLTGTTTVVHVTGAAEIGYSGGGTLDIGGTFTVGGNMDVAVNKSASGTVGVDGSGSDLAVSGQLVIGGAAAAGGTGAVTLASGGALTAGTLALYAGGTLTIDGTSSAEIGTANMAVTGQLVVDAGVTSGGSGEIAASVINRGDLVAQSGTLTITGQAAGDGLYDIAAGATFDLDQPGDVTLRFLGTTGTAILGTMSGTASLVQFSGNDTLRIAGIGAGAKVTYSGDAATVAGSQGSWTFNFGALPPGLQITTQGTDALVVACFVKGTLIATPAGEVPVERLLAGDAVQTLRGTARRIAWIGAGRVLSTRGRRTAATPVIVRRGALAGNVPHHDLHVTKGHALYIDDVLIPVEFLVNHRSIEWDDRAQEVTIYHIELATHDVLLANGAPAETYRDDGNRWLFQNANSGWELPPQEPCAPVLTGGPKLDAIWRRPLDRAGPRPGVTLTEDPDLHVLVGGERVDAASRHGAAHIFRLPAERRCVRVVSRAGAPAELGLARDPRVLGVAMRRIALRQGARFRLIEAADPALADGFHAFEPDNGLRWTDGDAGLPMALFEGFGGPMELVLHMGCTARYPLFGEKFLAAAA